MSANPSGPPWRGLAALQAEYCGEAGDLSRAEFLSRIGEAVMAERLDLEFGDGRALSWPEWSTAETERRKGAFMAQIHARRAEASGAARYNPFAARAPMQMGAAPSAPRPVTWQEASLDPRLRLHEGQIRKLFGGADPDGHGAAGDAAAVEVLAAVRERQTNNAETSCRRALAAMIRDSPNACPVKKEDLCKEMMEKDKRLRVRAFNRAWKAAIDETGALAWKTPGRKS